MLGLTFYFKLDWGSYIISIPKTASKKIGVLICSMQFFSLEVALYLYKSTICPCIEYCCHVWAGAPSCYMEFLDKLLKLIGRCSSELAQLVPLPFSQEGSTRYSDRLHDFSVTIPRYYKDVYVHSFFPCSARLWNSLRIESFPLTDDLSGFKSSFTDIF